MKNLKQVVSVFLIITSVTGIAATKRTVKKSTTNRNTTKPVAVGMANPASVYCVQNGGESINVKGEDGEFGVCKLKDGTAVEEWYYFRQNNPAPAPKNESVIGMPNPASKFCEDHGGKSVNVKDKNGNETGKCQFKDGTRVDEWDYYRENN